MSRPRGRFARSKARKGDSLRHQIPSPCPHSPRLTGFTLISALYRMAFSAQCKQFSLKHLKRQNTSYRLVSYRTSAHLSQNRQVSFSWSDCLARTLYPECSNSNSHTWGLFHRCSGNQQLPSLQTPWRCDPSELFQVLISLKFYITRRQPHFHASGIYM